MSLVIKSTAFLPIVQTVPFTGCIFLSAVIAITMRHVSPYMPFVSECGSYPPEGGIFTIGVTLLGCFTVALAVFRFLQMQAFKDVMDKSSKFRKINEISVRVGILAGFFAVATAANQMAVSFEVHCSAAAFGFTMYTVYALLQTWVTFQLPPGYYDKETFRKRLVLSVLNMLFFAISGISSVSGFSQWEEVSLEHWTGRKVPGDKGFLAMFVAGGAEWMSTILLVLYHLTFVTEFKNVTVRISASLSNHNSKSENFNSKSDPKALKSQ